MCAESESNGTKVINAEDKDDDRCGEACCTLDAILRVTKEQAPFNL